ncbi:MAG: DUF333 domain-containing protein [Candidatus Diapherotrites archaeon]|nr:DUF333 domain-containing protein [Candidatus Diapherotrites archaeon]
MMESYEGTYGEKKETAGQTKREEEIALAVLIGLLVVALFVLFDAFSLALSHDEGVQEQHAAQVPNTANASIDLASSYCKKQGYQLSSGSGPGEAVCVFPDGSKCEVLAFFRGSCQYPKNKCTDISPASNAPALTGKELDKGWYFGSCNQKKKNTPGDWAHLMEGTRSAMWYRPSNETGVSCDC